MSNDLEEFDKKVQEISDASPEEDQEALREESEQLENTIARLISKLEEDDEDSDE